MTRISVIKAEFLKSTISEECNNLLLDR